MRNAGIVMFESVDFPFINMDAMGSDHFGIKQTLLLDVRDDGHALVAAHVFNFKGGLGDVSV
ncbi:hypothetical protein SDC9_177045 [bioreactor metagenome]|uniref:Uncharacterized protein n=1 Tax=bioreactor metagenome TaxID=1076179 RepID=A0A645GUD0_9ZZZZ